MKKEIKAIIAVVLAVWFFVMGFELGAYKERKAQSTINTVNPVTTTQPTTLPTEPSTLPTEPSTLPAEPSTEPSAPADDNTTTQKQDEPTAPTAKDPLALSKAEIIAEVNKYVNQVKKEKNMTASTNGVVEVNVTECSFNGAVGTINNIIKNLTDAFGGQATYNFSNGQAVDADGNTVTPWDVIPPTRKDFSAVDAGVKDAKVEKVGNNIKYTIVMAAEETTMSSPVPAYNSTVIGYLDLAGLDLPITLTQADMHYPGSTVSVTVTPDGKVVELVNKLPMDGTGATKLLGREVFASFAGALDETWTFSY
jgi:hypothetical protein